MSKRTVFTTISPLPPSIDRETVVDFLHNHLEMIDLNPLVKERHPIKPPPHATPEEFHCTWYSLTDKISYLPGGLAAGDVSYTCAFHDLPTGLQTHCYAPMGLDIRDKWTLAGSLPGEPVEPVELGIGAPITGLYIREDVDMRCNVFMAGFVKRTLKKAHAALVERLKVKAQIVAAAETNRRVSMSVHQQQHLGSWQQQFAAAGAGQPPPMTRRGSVPTIPPIDTSVFRHPLFEGPGSALESPQRSNFASGAGGGGACLPYGHQHLHHSHHPSGVQSAVDDFASPFGVVADKRASVQVEAARLRRLSSSGYLNLRDAHGRISWQALKTPTAGGSPPSLASSVVATPASEHSSPFDGPGPYDEYSRRGSLHQLHKLHHHYHQQEQEQQPAVAELHTEIHGRATFPLLAPLPPLPGQHEKAGMGVPLRRPFIAELE